MEICSYLVHWFQQIPADDRHPRSVTKLMLIHSKLFQTPFFFLASATKRAAAHCLQRVKKSQERKRTRGHIDISPLALSFGLIRLCCCFNLANYLADWAEAEGVNEGNPPIPPNPPRTHRTLCNLLTCLQNSITRRRLDRMDSQIAWKPSPPPEMLSMTPFSPPWHDPPLFPS